MFLKDRQQFINERNISEIFGPPMSRKGMRTHYQISNAVGVEQADKLFPIGGELHFRRYPNLLDGSFQLPERVPQLTG